MSLEDLDVEHLAPFRQAIANILFSPHVELTYAQIIDGMPLSSVYTGDHWYHEGYPVLEHKTLCPGIIEKTRAFRSGFDILSLEFDTKIIQAYQSTLPGSIAWKLRLLELIAMACHNIAILLYQMDNGAHKHSEWTNWRLKRLAALSEPSNTWERGKCGPVTPFVIAPYHIPEELPSGLGDVVGYWAERQIFGGVVLFDRGESKEECNGIYIHNIRKASTLTPPTENQFKSIMDFLLNPDSKDCPLPITITAENKWRWNASSGRVIYNIFKYPSEVPIAIDRDSCHDRDEARNWPENNDYEVIQREIMKRKSGESFDESLIAEMWSRIKKTITPTSYLWEELEQEIIEMEPDEKKQGRPPYFFDP